MKTTSRIMKEAHKYCSYHNHPITKYCSKCKLNLCNQFSNHESYQIVSLDNIISTKNIITKVNKGHNHINLHCNERILIIT